VILKKVYFICVSLATIALFYVYAMQAKKYIIITDLEPDDRIALHVLAARIPHNEILFVGTTIKNAARKKALTRKLLDQLRLATIPVYQGSGGTAEMYYDIASSRAAREYEHEGKGILAEDELKVMSAMSYSSNELQQHIKSALETYDAIECIVLAPPTDLVAVLEKNPLLKKSIQHVYIMGGWSEQNENGNIVLRTTYNWNMDPQASTQLLDMKDIPMTVYSSHTIKKYFGGGSCNCDTCPRIINILEQYKDQLPSLIDQQIAAYSWDQHIIQKIPALKEVIEAYSGKQFTPADPLVVIGVINNNLIQKKIPVDLCIDLNDLDVAKGFRIQVTHNLSSNIQLVDSIDIEIFTKEFISSFELLVNNNHI